MTQSLAQNAIALLIDLAERGEINPWDVQVIDVIDRFLNELKPTEKVDVDRSVYEADLSQSGQAFLYASMLLLLKADNLARSEASPAEETLPAEEPEAEDLAANSIPLHLDRQLRRRAVAQPPQQRRVTLQELIDQLQLMAAAMEEQTPKKARTRRPRPQSRSQAVRAIAQLAHQENLTEVALELDQFLTSQWQQMSQGEEDWLDFEALLELWVQVVQHKNNVHAFHVNPHDDSIAQRKVSERVGIFWALLLLSAQSKVELSQEEFYQDLKIRSLADWSIYAVPE